MIYLDKLRNPLLDLCSESLAGWSGNSQRLDLGRPYVEALIDGRRWKGHPAPEGDDSKLLGLIKVIREGGGLSDFLRKQPDAERVSPVKIMGFLSEYGLSETALRKEVYLRDTRRFNRGIENFLVESISSFTDFYHRRPGLKSQPAALNSPHFLQGVINNLTAAQLKVSVGLTDQDLRDALKAVLHPLVSFRRKIAAEVYARFVNTAGALLSEAEVSLYERRALLELEDPQISKLMPGVSEAGVRQSVEAMLEKLPALGWLMNPERPSMRRIAQIGARETDREKMEKQVSLLLRTGGISERSVQAAVKSIDLQPGGLALGLQRLDAAGRARVFFAEAGLPRYQRSVFLAAAAQHPDASSFQVMASTCREVDSRFAGQSQFFRNSLTLFLFRQRGFRDLSPSGIGRALERRLQEVAQRVGQISEQLERMEVLPELRDAAITKFAVRTWDGKVPASELNRFLLQLGLAAYSQSYQAAFIPEIPENLLEKAAGVSWLEFRGQLARAVPGLGVATLESARQRVYQIMRALALRSGLVSQSMLDGGGAERLADFSRDPAAAREDKSLRELMARAVQLAAQQKADPS